MHERVVLIPVELVSALKWSLLILPAFFLLGGLGGNPSGFWNGVLNDGALCHTQFIGCTVGRGSLTPILLRWLQAEPFLRKA